MSVSWHVIVVTIKSPRGQANSTREVMELGVRRVADQVRENGAVGGPQRGIDENHWAEAYLWITSEARWRIVLTSGYPPGRTGGRAVGFKGAHHGIQC